MCTEVLRGGQAHLPSPVGSDVSGNWVQLRSVREFLRELVRDQERVRRPADVLIAPTLRDLMWAATPRHEA